MKGRGKLGLLSTPTLALLPAFAEAASRRQASGGGDRSGKFQIFLFNICFKSIGISGSLIERSYLWVFLQFFGLKSLLARLGELGQHNEQQDNGGHNQKGEGNRAEDKDERIAARK